MPNHGQTPEILAEYAAIFRVLGEATRLRILLLLEERPMTVGEIVSRFDLAQPTISRHLRLMADAGLVSSSRAGQHVTYCLRRDRIVEGVTEFRGWFGRGADQHAPDSSG